MSPLWPGRTKAPQVWAAARVGDQPIIARQRGVRSEGDDAAVDGQRRTAEVDQVAAIDAVAISSGADLARQVQVEAKCGVGVGGQPAIDVQGAISGGQGRAGSDGVRAATGHDCSADHAAAWAGGQDAAVERHGAGACGRHHSCVRDQRAGVERRGAGIGVRCGKRQRARADLQQAPGTRKRAGQGQRVAVAVEDSIASRVAENHGHAGGKVRRGLEGPSAGVKCRSAAALKQAGKGQQPAVEIVGSRGNADFAKDEITGNGTGSAGNGVGSARLREAAVSAVADEFRRCGKNAAAAQAVRSVVDGQIGGHRIASARSA